MPKFLIVLFLAVMTTSCGPRYVDYFPCHDDGTCKPAVALLPIVDCTSAKGSEVAADEIFKVIQTNAMDQGELYFLSPEEMQDGESLGKAIDFKTDPTQLGHCFNAADFVVIMELIEQDYSSMGQCKPPVNTATICYPAEVLLTLKVRLKVIDVRPRCPRVVLQEIFAQGFFMPCPDGYDAQVPVKAYRRFGINLENRLEQIVRSAY